MNAKLTILWAIFTVLFVSLSACKATDEEKELPFETVVKTGSLRLLYQNIGTPPTLADKELLISTNRDEVRQVVGTLFPDYSDLSFEEIENIDYNQYFVIVVYGGFTGSGSFRINIDKVIQKGQEITVTVSLEKPSSGGSGDEGYPVHAVTLKRSDLLMAGQLEFVMVQDGQVVLTREHSVP